MYKRLKTVAINAYGIKGAIAAFDQDGNQIPELNREQDLEGFWLDRLKNYWADDETEFVNSIDWKP